MQRPKLPIQRKILVTGFGPFLDISENPAQRLALAVDECRVGNFTIVGRALPVSYARSVELTLNLVDEISPAWVIGLGVARGSKQAKVESQASRFVDPTKCDNDGVSLGDLKSAGPDVLPSNAPISELAQLLGADISHDAGKYVCNAWYYCVLNSAAEWTRVSFIHVPTQGLDRDGFVDALIRVMPLFEVARNSREWVKK